MTSLLMDDAVSAELDRLLTGTTGREIYGQKVAPGETEDRVSVKMSEEGGEGEDEEPENIEEMSFRGFSDGLAARSDRGALVVM